MTLTTEITDELEAVLKNQAEAQGVSAEHYALRVLEHDLRGGGGPRKHISEVIREDCRPYACGLHAVAKMGSYSCADGL